MDSVNLPPLDPLGANTLAAAEQLQGARRPGVPAPVERNEGAWKAAEKFEAMMLGQMVDTMFADVAQEGFFGGGQQSKMWQSFLSQHLGETLAGGGTLGIAEAVYRDIAGLYGAVDKAGASQNGESGDGGAA